MAHISYTMFNRGLPDMYTLSPRASGVHIRQTTRVHGITITYMIYIYIYVIYIYIIYIYIYIYIYVYIYIYYICDQLCENPPCSHFGTFSVFCIKCMLQLYIYLLQSFAAIFRFCVELWKPLLAIHFLSTVELAIIVYP